MPLYNNVVKQGALLNGKKAPIVTAQPKKHHQQADLLADGNLTPEELELKRQSKRQEAKLNQLRSEIISQAQAEGQQIKDQAHQAGFESGQKAGYEAGYQEGLTEGNKVAAEIVNQAQANLEAANKEVKDFVQTEKQAIINYGIKMAEVLLKSELKADSSKILALLEPILFELEKPDQVIIVKAHSRYHQDLNQRLEIMKQNSNVRYAILDDNSLGVDKVVVESDEALLTLDIHEELENYFKALIEKEQNENWFWRIN